MGYHTNPPPTSNPPASFLRLEGSHKAKPPAPVWHCAYCGQSNAAEREGCRGCQAARPARAELVESESFKERWEAQYKGTESWADIAVLGGGEPIRVYGRPEPETRPINLGTWVCEQGDNKAAQHAILQRLKQCVGLR